MKTLFNWRQLVLSTLFIVGMIALMAAVGSPAGPADDLEWFRQFFLSLSIALPSFYALAKLTGKWEREGKIHQY